MNKNNFISKKRLQKKKRRAKKPKLFIPSSAEAFDGETQRKPPNPLEALARQMGEIMTDIGMEQRKRGPKHKMFHCPSCHKTFCITATGTDHYCKGCFVLENKEKIEASGGTFAGCMCTHYGERKCIDCGGI